MIEAVVTVLLVFFGLFFVLFGVVSLLRLAGGSHRSAGASAISAPTGGAFTGAFAGTYRVFRRASWLLLTVLWGAGMYFFAMMILPHASEAWSAVSLLSALLFGAWALKR